MMHLGPDRIGLREQADLVQGHALFEEHARGRIFSVASLRKLLCGKAA
jgi:hypothetical protein